MFHISKRVDSSLLYWLNKSCNSSFLCVLLLYSTTICRISSCHTPTHIHTQTSLSAGKTIRVNAECNWIFFPVCKWWILFYTWSRIFTVTGQHDYKAWSDFSELLIHNYHAHTVYVCFLSVEDLLKNIPDQWLCAGCSPPSNPIRTLNVTF